MGDHKLSLMRVLNSHPNTKAVELGEFKEMKPSRQFYFSNIKLQLQPETINSVVIPVFYKSNIGELFHLCLWRKYHKLLKRTDFTDGKETTYLTRAALILVIY